MFIFSLFGLLCIECVNQQFGANFHRICEAQTLGNSMKVGLKAGYLSVRTAGGASDRH